MSRLLIQSDWDEVFSQNDGGQCWISYKLSPSQGTAGSDVVGGTSDHGYIQFNSTGQESPPATSNERFTITSLTQKTIDVQYYHSDTSQHHKTKFIAAHKQYVHFDKKQSVSCVDVSSAGLGVSCSSNTLKVWDSQSGDIRRELSGHVSDVYSCKFFPSGVVVLSCGADMMVKVWSAADGSCPRTLRGHTRGVRDTYIIGKGRRIVSCSSDGTARLWDCGQGQCVSVLYSSVGEGGAATRLPTSINTCHGYDAGAADDEGNVLALGSEDGTVQIVDINSGNLVCGVRCGSEGVTSGSESVTTVKFLTDSAPQHMLCVGSNAGFVYRYDMRNITTPLHTSHLTSRGSINSITQLNSEYLIISTGDGSCLYQRCDGTVMSSDTELTGPDCDPVYNVTTDASHIYTSCRDGVVRVYNMTT